MDSYWGEKKKKKIREPSSYIYQQLFKLVCNFTLYYRAVIFSTLSMESSSVYLKARLCD